MKSKQQHSHEVPVAALERVSCRNLTVARLTLGLIDSICGDKPSSLFSEYSWSPADVWRFPKDLVKHAKQLLDAAKPGMTLNALLLSRLKITRAVHNMRRRSPYGRRQMKIAGRWRNEYPQLQPTPSGPIRDQSQLHSVAILADEIGRPLGLYTILLVRAFKPSRIEILAAREGEYWVREPGQIKIRLSEDGYSVAGIEYTVEAEPATQRTLIHGVLEDFFETGTEGVIWSVIDDDARGYAALCPIDAGDHLTIQDQLGRKIWSGIIRCDRKSGWTRYPLNPQHGQPIALGHWVHWTQRGFKPDDWARFFIRPNYDRLRGILRKKRVTRAPVSTS